MLSARGVLAAVAVAAAVSAVFILAGCGEEEEEKKTCKVSDAKIMHRTLAPLLAPPSFTQWRWTTLNVRAGVLPRGSAAIHYSEIEWWDNALQISTSGAVATTTKSACTGGAPLNNGGEIASMAIDGDTSTKACCCMAVIQVTFPQAISATRFRYATGNDASSRDPFRWIMEATNDGNAWDVVHDQTRTDAAVPTARRTFTEHFSMMRQSGLLAEIWDWGRSSFPGYTSKHNYGVPKETTWEAQVNHPKKNSLTSVFPSKEKFTIRWTGLISISQRKTYTFYLESDDGSMLWIDDGLIVDNDGTHGMREKKGNVQLSSGTHRVRIEFYENTGNAGCIWRWSASGTPKGLVPANLLSHVPDKPKGEVPLNTDCWDACGKRGGYCSACDSTQGPRGACCRKGSADDPEECLRAPTLSNIPFHNCVLVQAPPSFTHWRWTTSKVRAGVLPRGSAAIQYSEIEWSNNAGKISMTGAIAATSMSACSGGSPATTAGPHASMAIDGDTNTTACCCMAVIQVTFPQAISPTGFRYATGDNYSSRDPLRWIMEASNDSIAWSVVRDQRNTDVVVPTARRTFTESFSMMQAAGLMAQIWDWDGDCDFPGYTHKHNYGVPKDTRSDAEVNHAKTESAFSIFPASAEKFTIRWTGLISISQRKTYTFYLESDDGSMLWIDDGLIVDNDGLHAMGETKGNVQLSSGTHRVRIEFYEKTGTAGCIWKWSGTGIPKAVVPANVLSHFFSPEASPHHFSLPAPGPAPLAPAPAPVAKSPSPTKKNEEKKSDADKEESTGGIVVLSLIVVLLVLIMLGWICTKKRRNGTGSIDKVRTSTDVGEAEKVQNNKIIAAMQTFMDQTFRDRSYKGQFKPQRLQVMEVYRVKNYSAMADLDEYKNELRERRGVCQPLHEQVLSANPPQELEANSDPTLNEYLMFHGTSAEAANAIIETDFRLPKSHTHGAVYGAGIYIAETNTKGHMYCSPDSRGWVPMLVVRTILGNVHNTDVESPDTDDLLRMANAGVIDSVCGDRRKLRYNFSGWREFIVYDNAQVAVEWLIWCKPK